MGVRDAVKNVVAKVGSDPVARLEAEVVKLNAEGAALVAQINDLEAQENDVEDAGALSTAMVATRAAKNRLRKLDERLVETRAKLDLARDEARAKLLAKLQAAHDAAAADFFARASIASVAATNLIAARDALQDAGFRQAYNMTPTPPMIGPAVVIAPEMIEAYGRMIKGDSQPWRPDSIAAANPTLKLDPPAPRPRAKAELRPQRPATKEARALLRETAGEGEVLMSVIRPGLEHWRTGEGLTIGDVIAVKTSDAQALAINGAASHTTPEEVAAVDASVRVTNGQTVPGAAAATGPWERIDNISDATLAHRASTETVQQ